MELMSDLAITPSVVEGPYFRLGAPRRDSLIEPGITGERLLLTGCVLNTHGRPIPGAVLQFWTSDDKGNYDMVGYQLHGYTLADERGIQVQESPDGGKTGDILTHVCTASPGGVMDPNDSARRLLPGVSEARARGVVLDPALGRGNFGVDVARHQADLGLHPDTLSSDVTLGGRSRGVGLLDSMSKFLSLGYSLSDVVRMASTNAARAIGLQDQIGALAVGREADISIFDVVSGKWKFADSRDTPFTCDKVLVPVQTLRAGEMFSPDWGPYPWGWLPEEA